MTDQRLPASSEAADSAQDDPLFEQARQCDSFTDYEELGHAIRHIRQSKTFGRSERTVSPFSRQLRLEIRSQFEIDEALFAASETTAAHLRILTLLMRALTISLFVLFCLAAASLAAGYAGIAERSILPLLPLAVPAGSGGALLGWSLGVGAAATLLRWAVRSLFFLIINREVAQLSHDLASGWDAIDSRVVDCCLEAQKRGRDWQIRSRLYTILAVWNLKRAEYLDRYSTTITWKIRDFVRVVEGISMVLKGAAALALLAHLAFGPLRQEPALLAGCAAIIGAVWIGGFFFLGRMTNERWTDVLRRDIVTGDDPDKHHFLRLGDLVGNLAQTVLEVQRTQLSGGTGMQRTG